MKKIAAILLLGIFVFNLFGYRIWLSYLENKANRSLETAMENNNYNSDELICAILNLPFSQIYGIISLKSYLATKNLKFMI